MSLAPGSIGVDVANPASPAPYVNLGSFPLDEPVMLPELCPSAELTEEFA